jgi:hypothetical protein
VSAVAAEAAAYPVVPGPRSVRSRLVQVPAQAGPAPKAKAGHPLALSRATRRRLRAAVRALLDAVQGAPDSVRWATIVLASRTPVTSGRVVIRTRELGRWLGLSKSRTASAVVPGLRRSGAVEIDTEPGEFGQDNALVCKVAPLWEARGVLGHPLALSQKEFALLWALVNAIAAPGWSHRDGSVTAPGLLGKRTGRGGATDRLALLLLVLEATATGRVRQRGGMVDRHRGRGVATLVQLLDCGTAGAERILKRLMSDSLVNRLRLATGSGLHQRTQLVVPTVAAAHRQSSADVVVDAVRKVRQVAAGPDFSEPDDAATGSTTPSQKEERQVSGGEVAAEAEKAEPDDAATLHTEHSPVVDAIGDVRLGGGFSGEAASGNPPLPGRACAREDVPENVPEDGGDRSEPQLTPVGGSGGPLRGEQPESPAHTPETHGHSPGHEDSQSVVQDDGSGLPGRDLPLRVLELYTGGHHRRRGQVPRPPVDLETVVAPAGALWARLNRDGARRKVVTVARRELTAIAGVTGARAAEQVLAGRLRRRLAEQGGPAQVKDPVGWLIGKGLPRRPGCGDPRCDDGARIDTGGICQACQGRIADRRAVRRQVAAEVDAQFEAAAPDQVRAETERRLQHETRLETARRQARWKRAAAERAARQAAADQARAQAEAERQARQAVACADCGAPRATGLCPACGNRRAAREQLREAALIVAAHRVDSDSRQEIDDVVARAEATGRADIAAALAQAREQGATDDTLALLERLEAERARDRCRSEALGHFARSPEADAEAQLAHAAKLRTRHLHSDTFTAAVQAAKEAAEQARWRTAHHLLNIHLAAVRTAVGEPSSALQQRPVRTRWADRLADIARRPLSTEKPQETA